MLMVSNLNSIETKEKKSLSLLSEKEEKNKKIVVNLSTTIQSIPK